MEMSLTHPIQLLKEITYKIRKTLRSHKALIFMWMLLVQSHTKFLTKVRILKILELASLWIFQQKISSQQQKLNKTGKGHLLFLQSSTWMWMLLSFERSYSSWDGIKVMKVASSPDILVAVDVDSVKLVLEVFVLYICHVVDHFQNYKTWQHW